MNTHSAQIKDVLEAFWDQNVIPTASVDGSAVDEMFIPLDSLTACAVLIDLEPIVGRELPVGEIVKRGGYLTKEEFIADVTDAVLTCMGESP